MINCLKYVDEYIINLTFEGSRFQKPDTNLALKHILFCPIIAWVENFSSTGRKFPNLIIENYYKNKI